MEPPTKAIDGVLVCNIWEQNSKIILFVISKLMKNPIGARCSKKIGAGGIIISEI